MDWRNLFAPKNIKKQIILPLLTILIGITITIAAVAAYKNYQETITRSKMELDAMTYAEHMKADIVNGIGATTALEEIIISNGGYINRFSTVAEDLMTDVIQSIQIAPGGVVTDIYPAEGNEAGRMDLIHDPDRGEISRYARDHHVMIMQGPFTLRQGGDGIAVRNPVYLQQEDGSEVFWGLTIVIIRVPEIFSEALVGLTGFGYDFRLSKTVSPWDMTFEEVSGSGAVAAGAASYLFEIGDSQWKLEVSPRGGWYNGTVLLLLFGTGLALVLLLAGFEYVLLVQSDYREKARNNEKLEKALAAAQAANTAKTYFLNNMSHDLRTPLNAILGYTRLLEKENAVPAEDNAYLHKIEESGEHLLSILNNMLDMARMDSGEVALEEETYCIDPAGPLTTEAFAKAIQKKNIHFTQDVAIEHRYVVLDFAKVEQIYCNLLENAIKYTPEGGSIHVEIKELPCERAGYAFNRIAVSDNGIGMSEAFQEHLFESFSRERNTTESKVIGTGLGLAIVKKLVDMMGGTIEVASRPGEGSTFRVYLTHRIADCPEAQGENREPEDASDILFGKRVLLAEDNELNAEIAMAVLEDMGIQTEWAEDGMVCVEMLEKAEAGYYDLILMDIQMPNMDGYEATRTIRGMADNTKSGIPIVALTANAFEEDRKKAFAAGMNGHLAKPIDVSKLEETLASTVRA